MEEAVRNFHTQFLWKPTVVNVERLPRARAFILNGMGGSHLAADLLRAYKPEVDLSVFSDYGIPPLPPVRLSNSLCIASSFSGNTEEAIDFAEHALTKGLPVAVIAKGGKLLMLAQKHKLPYVVLPPVNIQPRSGLGYQMLALAALLQDVPLQKELAALAPVLKPEKLEEKGTALAAALRGKVPVVYSSVRNSAVAYNWKIKFNETGKIPAFYNVFPELNHNEMTGFSAEGGPASGGDVSQEAAALSNNFHFIFLTDDADHPQIQKRMKVTRKLYEERGLPVTEAPITPPALTDSGTPLTRGDKGDNRLANIFVSLLIADWTALHLSRLYGTEAEQVPMVEEFKKLVH